MLVCDNKCFAVTVSAPSRDKKYRVACGTKCADATEHRFGIKVFYSVRAMAARNQVMTLPTAISVELNPAIP